MSYHIGRVIIKPLTTIYFPLKSRSLIIALLPSLNLKGEDRRIWNKFPDLQLIGQININRNGAGLLNHCEKNKKIIFRKFEMKN